MPASLTIEDFGSQLKYLRKSAHLTQRDLAQAVGYTEAHICRL
jgi:transcriptional regulator with XRE-family HTH domain